MEAIVARAVCVVVPCYDEEQVVEHTYGELCRVFSTLPQVRFSICFVDDGSRDGTLLVLNRLARDDPRVRVLALSRNFGHQVAITAGLDHADRRADAVLVMDADLETPPDLLPAMLDALARGHDVVMGVRAVERAVGRFRRLSSKAFYWGFNALSDVTIAPGAPDFYLLSARARDAIGRMPEQRRFLRAMVTWIGFPRAYVSYVPRARPFGRSKYTLRKMGRLASDALFGFSSAPLKLTFAAGTLLSTLGALLLTREAWGAALGRAVQMIPFALGLTGFAVGAVLLGVGLVGTYVARVLEESRGRPLYLVKQAPEERAAEGRLVDVNAVVTRRVSR